jgi:phage terminase large subunit
MWQIGEKYKDFFMMAKDERVLIMQGSRRSGKTTNTFLYMLALSYITKNQRYTTLTYQYPQLTKTMTDFERASGVKIRRTKEGYSYTDNNGNMFLFDHCDDTSKALGNYCDLLFINESVNVPEDIADNYMLGCTQRVILNFNPIKHGWHERYQNENNLLKTTFKDNPYLPQAQIDAFERLKSRAASIHATPLDKYNYQVYYLGEYSNVSGQIFTNVRTITYNEYVNIPANECLAIDFGFRDGGDATSLVGVKIYNKTIYAHCYIYDNSLERLSDLHEALEKAGVSSSITVWGDYGGMGRSRMDDLICTYGYTMCDAIKPKIMDNISRMLSFEGGLAITENSDLMLKEVSEYEMVNGKLSEKNNHSIDAMRYAFNAATFYG